MYAKGDYHIIRRNQRGSGSAQIQAENNYRFCLRGQKKNKPIPAKTDEHFICRRHLISSTAPLSKPAGGETESRILPGVFLYNIILQNVLANKKHVCDLLQKHDKILKITRMCH